MACRIVRNGAAAALFASAAVASACTPSVPSEPVVEATPIEDALVEPVDEIQTVSPHMDDAITAPGTVEIVLDGVPVRFDIGLGLDIDWIELDDGDISGRIASLTVADGIDVMLFVADAIASPEPGPVDPLHADSDPVAEFHAIAEQTDAYTIEDATDPRAAGEDPTIYLRLSDVDDEVPLFYVVARDDPSIAAALSVEPDAEADSSHVWLTWLDDRWIGMLAGIADDDADVFDDAMRSLRTP